MFLNEHIEQIKKMKVVIDAGNGMGGVDSEILQKYLNVVPMNFKPDGNFPVHTPNPILAENIKDICKRVRKEKAVLGIAFDGDVDRVVFIDCYL